MTKVIITGVNGFVGSNIAEKFLNEGYEVHGLVRQTSDLKFLEGLDVKLHYGDITDPESLNSAFKGMDWVIHTAAMASDWGKFEKFLKVNVEGTLNVARACTAQNIKKLVYISTVAMYGFGRLDVRESDSKAVTKFPYNESKRIAEEKLQEYAKLNGLYFVSIKPGNIYGIRDHTFIEKYLDAMIGGKVAYVDAGRHKTCPVYIENLTQAIMLAATSNINSGESYFITDGMDITWREFTDKFAEKMNLKKPKQSFPFFVAYSVAWLMENVYKILNAKNPPLLTTYRVSNGGMDYTFSIEKARKQLGFNPVVEFDEAVERTVQWYQNRKK